MKRILVTGGAGYIGCVLVPSLLEGGYEVVVFDNLMYGGTGLLACVRYPRFEFYKGDVRDRQALRDAAKDCDVIVHLAAIVGFPACAKNPQLAEAVNCDGARAVAEVAGRERLVLLGSTGSNYGEVTDAICTEDTPLNPVSLYGQTKVFAEQYLRERCNTVAFRFATAFGLSPRPRSDLMVNDFVYRAMKDGYLVVYEAHFMRTFIHVVDIARSFLFAIDKSDVMKGNVYNVGSENMNYSKAQLCEMIKRALFDRGLKCYVHHAEVGQDADRRNYVVSYQKISQLGFSTTIDLASGVAELIRGLQLIEIPTPYSNA
jgi:nucleoside-diphosphate-sugar epimerase